MRIVIIGTGAVGGVVAAILKREGLDIQVVTRHPDLAIKIRREGIHAFGHCGNVKIRIPAVAAVSDLDGSYDLALLAMKGYDLPYASNNLLPFLHPDSRVVSFQNGICEETLAGIIGVERTIGCSVGWGATMHEPGKVEMTSGGEFLLGNWKRERDQKLEEIGQILNHIAEARITNHIESGLYSKLIVNSCITTLGVVTGLYLGEMLSMRKARNIFIQIIREAKDQGSRYS
jgi:2-dehydropantoate 2-reductase